MPHYAEFESDTTTSEPTPIKHAAENWKQPRKQTLTADFWIETFGPHFFFFYSVFCIWMHWFGVKAKCCWNKKKRRGINHNLHEVEQPPPCRRLAVVLAVLQEAVLVLAVDPALEGGGTSDSQAVRALRRDRAALCLVRGVTRWQPAASAAARKSSLPTFPECEPKMSGVITRLSAAPRHYHTAGKINKSTRWQAKSNTLLFIYTQSYQQVIN